VNVLARRAVVLGTALLLAACQAGPVVPPATNRAATTGTALASDLPDPAASEPGASAGLPAASVSPMPSAMPPPVVTATWVLPKNGATLAAGKVKLSAKASSSAADAPVSRVEFRAAWGTAASRLACTATHADGSGNWTCTADMAHIGAPRGRVTLSADVVVGGRVATTAVSRAVTYHADAVTIPSSTGCDHVVAGIDGQGGYHLAGICGGRVRYWRRLDDGTWDVTSFKRETRREDGGVFIGFLDDRVVLAWTRFSVSYEEGCGDGEASVADLGVYYRSKSLTGSSWTTPTKVGAARDWLTAFRAANGTMYFAVYPWKATGIVLRTVAGSANYGVALPSAYGFSMRVGSDGQLRVAYQTASGVRYGSFTGSAFKTEAVRGGSVVTYGVTLALDAADTPSILWVRDNLAWGGCAEPPPDPKNGIYVATRSGGAWHVKRITPQTGPTALGVNKVDGTLYALVAAEDALLLEVGRRGKAWTETSLGRNVTDTWVYAPAILVDPFTGVQLIAYVRESADGRPVIRFTTRV